ncbi:MAG: phosphatase PAP2 family protein [Desulfobacteraceae bacterium]|nr:phosphatase PAP2 family protein [Desulfobacteraceae bacterium]
MAQTNQSSVVAGAVRSYFGPFVPAAAVLLIATVLFRTTGLDIAISSFFFTPEGGWSSANLPVCSFFYHYGTWPGLGLTIFSGLILAAGFFRKNLQEWRKPAIFVLLLLAIGPGLFVNAIFKAHWERPRPKEVVAFGGDKQFLKVWDKGKAGDGRSFPSGHASMGFFLGAPYFFLRDSKRKRALGWMVFGIACGVAIGTVRIAQGGHFASDVAWSWGMVHLSGLALWGLLGKGGKNRPEYGRYLSGLTRNRVGSICFRACP